MKLSDFTLSVEQLKGTMDGKPFDIPMKTYSGHKEANGQLVVASYLFDKKLLMNI